MELTGVKALVTGAGAGIGRAIAGRLAAGGCRVACADVRGDTVRQTVADLQGRGYTALAIQADVAVADDVARMVREAVEFLGGLDVLVNNAGVSSTGFIEQVTDAELMRVFDINLTGVVRVTRAATPYLKQSARGRIINLSSVEGIRGSGMLPSYCSAKAGVLGLTRANAVELGYYGITVNALCPGAIETDMLAPLSTDERERQKLIKSIPLKRLGTPADVASAVAFLASEEAGYITGCTLVIDGGKTVKT